MLLLLNVRWCDANYLTINVKKTEEMVLDPLSVGDHTRLQIHGEKINQVSSYKYPGIYLDKHFSWGRHITRLCSCYSKGCIFCTD